MMAMEDNYLLCHHQQSWVRDHPQALEDDDLHEQFMPLAAMASPVSSQASTGYLQDAVAEWSDCSKRRRLAAAASSSSPLLDSAVTTEELQDLLQAFWGSSCYADPSHVLQDNVIFQDEKTMNVMMEEAKTQASTMMISSSSSTSIEDAQYSTLQVDEKDDRLHQSKPCTTSKVKALPFKECDDDKKKKKKKMMSVAYPFAVVKPGGDEGDVTLDDINARIMMRPRRPVRHPVGEYAHGPGVSPEGPGLSGKAVVSLTRIQTQGRGTITIIRTKG
ncbi:hypothetical protein Cni_G15354 [Canna indica]|uniref:Protein XRI1 n=1 Tax=Canna indica TaxID=4628 RepID=A0AAQ3KFZ1_9LILI|nr:hypothetical protein Cni_G15354 [Canna indica]